jgi:hypothetical protein
MPIFVAQRGDFCLLTAEGYLEAMESRHFLPVSLAGWAPENESVVGYLEGETIYRLVDESTWLDMMRAYRQRMLGNVLGDLKKRGLYDGDPDRSDSDWN